MSLPRFFPAKVRDQTAHPGYQASTMKSSLIALLAASAAALTQSLHAGAFGPGPWANGSYYPGGLDGKYQAVVFPPQGTGTGITGVLGFAIVEGAPPILQQVVEEAAPNGGAVARNIVNIVDPFQNYFAVFVGGRAYAGATTAGVNIDTKQVSGTLRGTDPGATPDFFVGGTVIVPDLDVAPILNRGLSGGFQAKVSENRAVFTFNGNGRLSTPDDNQRVTATVTTDVANRGPAANPTGQTVTMTSQGNVDTATTPFGLSGIRTSFISRNAVASAQLAGIQSGGGGN